MTTTIPDVEGAIRDWLRQQPAITALVDNRVFFGVSGDVFPQITVRLIDGRMDLSEAPISGDLIQFDCWGPKPGTGNAKSIATAVKNTLIGVLWDLRSGTTLVTGTLCLGVYNISAIWLPDPQSNQAVYRVSATVSAIQQAA